MAHSAPDTDDIYVDAAYLTAKYQTGPAAIRAAVKRGDLPAFRVGPKLLRFRKADADAWAKQIPAHAHG